jgi:hypothetical protein
MAPNDDKTYYVPIKEPCLIPVQSTVALGQGSVKIECDPAVGLLFVYASMSALRADYPDAKIDDVMELAIKVIAIDGGFRREVTIREGVYWHEPTVDERARHRGGDDGTD